MKFPHYLQHDAMDCGPTCLRIISAHYGKRYSLEGLRERAHITREGVSMLGIAEAAENIGFRTMGVKVSVEKLREAPLPCVEHRNQNHFVVLYKIKNRHTDNTDTTDNHGLNSKKIRVHLSNPCHPCAKKNAVSRFRPRWQ